MPKRIRPRDESRFGVATARGRVGGSGRSRRSSAPCRKTRRGLRCEPEGRIPSVTTAYASARTTASTSSRFETSNQAFGPPVQKQEGLRVRGRTSLPPRVRDDVEGRPHRSYRIFFFPSILLQLERDVGNGRVQITVMKYRRGRGAESRELRAAGTTRNEQKRDHAESAGELPEVVVAETRMQRRVLLASVLDEEWPKRLMSGITTRPSIVSQRTRSRARRRSPSRRGASPESIRRKTTKSKGTKSPVSSTKKQRSASPSKATPKSGTLRGLSNDEFAILGRSGLGSGSGTPLRLK